MQIFYRYILLSIGRAKAFSIMSYRVLFIFFLTYCVFSIDIYCIFLYFATCQLLCSSDLYFPNKGNAVFSLSEKGHTFLNVLLIMAELAVLAQAPYCFCCDSPVTEVIFVSL